MSVSDIAPAAPVEATPIAPVVADVAPAAAAPSVEAAPVVAPVVEAAPVAPVAPPAPTLLGEPTPEPVAPVAEPTADSPIENAEGQSDEPAPLPTYEPFTYPTGLVPAEGRLAEFTELLGGFEAKSKAGHEFVQEFGQSLIDYHVAEVQKTVERIEQARQAEAAAQAHADLEAFRADPEIGGNRADTTVAAVNKLIRTHFGTEAEQAEFRAVLVKANLANNPVVIRALARVAAAKGEGRQLAAVAPPPAPKSKTQAMYGKRA
jgi:hypothetical protein